jgi:hypothetical protein
MKTLWASVQTDPVFMRRVNGWMTVFWIVMIIPSFVLGWVNSVMYVSFLSLWALVSGHWSTWQAARTEVRQQEAEHLYNDPSGMTTVRVRPVEPKQATAMRVDRNGKPLPSQGVSM